MQHRNTRHHRDSKQMETFKHRNTESKHDGVEPTPKVGRTLLVKSATTNSNIDESEFSNLQGLVTKFQTKSSQSFFLTFDSLENATKAYTTLNCNSNFRVKYSYYRTFFTLKGLTLDSDYNMVKKELMDHVLEKTGAMVLYCKFYRKDNNYIGCGDLTVDTMEGMNSLLNKESGLKDFSFGSYSGSFFRFNNSTTKNRNMTESH